MLSTATIRSLSTISSKLSRSSSSCRAHSSSAFTLSSTSASSLHQALEVRLAQLTRSDSSVLLYSVSNSLPPRWADACLGAFQRLPTSVGLLSSPSFSLSPHLHSISVASLEGRAFQSSAQGPPSISVGRKPPEAAPTSSAFQKGLAHAMESGNWDSIWDTSKSDMEDQTVLGEEWTGLEDVDPKDVETLILLATPTAARPSLRALSGWAPSSSRVGIIASPAIGRLSPLFYKVEGASESVVGIAILRSSAPSAAASRLSVEWKGIQQLGDSVCEVTKSQGNMLLGLDLVTTSRDSQQAGPVPSSISTNPTQHLITLLSSSSSADLVNASVGAGWLGGKDKDFFVGFLGDSGVTRVVKILSGDPKRGGMALDCEESVRVGERFVFLHRPSSSQAPKPSSPPSSSSSSSVVFDFSTVPALSHALPSASDDELKAAVEVEEGVFHAGSERGFLWGEAGRDGFVDNGVPGGSVRLVLARS